MIPWWVPLAAAAIALLRTVVGVLITQRWSAHREAARWNRGCWSPASGTATFPGAADHRLLLGPTLRRACGAGDVGTGLARWPASHVPALTRATTGHSTTPATASAPAPR